MSVAGFKGYKHSCFGMRILPCCYGNGLAYYVSDIRNLLIGESVYSLLLIHKYYFETVILSQLLQYASQKTSKDFPIQRIQRTRYIEYTYNSVSKSEKSQKSSLSEKNAPLGKGPKYFVANL